MAHYPEFRIQFKRLKRAREALEAKVVGFVIWWSCTHKFLENWCKVVNSSRLTFCHQGRGEWENAMIDHSLSIWSNIKLSTQIYEKLDFHSPLASLVAMACTYFVHRKSEEIKKREVVSCKMLFLTKIENNVIVFVVMGLSEGEITFDFRAAVWNMIKKVQ